MNLRIDHLAFPSFDAAETYRFYTKVMGFRLAASMQGVSEAWGNKPYLLMVFANQSGQTFDFFALDGMRRPKPDGLPKDIRHVALAVKSRRDFGVWKKRLNAHAVEFWEEDHGGGCLSIYFSDPNGVMFEVTVGSSAFDEGAGRDGVEVIRRWTAARRRRPAPPRMPSTQSRRNRRAGGSAPSS